jgi:hypothetical protein
LIVILVCMTLGTIVFLGWEIIQRWAAPLATPTLAATASTRSSMLLPSLTTIPTGIPSATPTPAGQTPSGPGLLYFTGENGCVIRWVSAQGGDSLTVGTLPADDCLTDANHWSVKRWSPDGSLFAMAMMDASQGSSPAAYTIQIMRFDGTPVYQLISGSGSIPTAGLAWSPDSKNLAYVVLNDTEGLTEMFGPCEWTTHRGRGLYGVDGRIHQPRRYDPARATLCLVAGWTGFGSFGGGYHQQAGRIVPRKIDRDRLQPVCDGPTDERERELVAGR